MPVASGPRATPPAAVPAATAGSPRATPPGAAVRGSAGGVAAPGARARAPIAYLAPEIPSVSATFVYREIAALEAEGVRIAPFSMHPVAESAVSEDGRRFLGRVEALYAHKGRTALGALRTALRHPVRALATLGLAARDALFGRFSRPRQRLRLLAQAVAGLHLAGRLEAAGASHLHVHFAHAPASIGMYAARAAGIPFSVTAHANDLYAEASLLAEKVRRARAFVTISEANRRFLAGALGAAASRVGVVRCGIDLRAFRARTQEPSGAPVVFALGRLVPKKGFDVLLRALALAAPRVPGLSLEIAGNGPERAGLMRLARELGIEGRVRLLGAVSRDEVLRRLAGAAAFALPCRVDAAGDRDGIPVALMEAMAVGVPVVSTRLSGVPELVRDGESGLLVSPGDAGELASALTRLIGDAALRARIARTGRAHVEASFEVRSNARRLLARFSA